LSKKAANWFSTVIALDSGQCGGLQSEWPVGMSVGVTFWQPVRLIVGFRRIFSDRLARASAAVSVAALALPRREDVGVTVWCSSLPTHVGGISIT